VEDAPLVLIKQPLDALVEFLKRFIQLSLGPDVDSDEAVGELEASGIK